MDLVFDAQIAAPSISKKSSSHTKPSEKIASIKFSSDGNTFIRTTQIKLKSIKPLPSASEEFESEWQKTLEPSIKAIFADGSASI